MTRDEALKRVKGYLTDYISADCYGEVEEIMEALEQQPCDDCISRQAVIKLLSYDWANRPAHKAVESVKNLPSVTPKEKTGRWISLGIQGEIDGQIVRAFTCSKCGAISIFRMTDGKIINGDLCPNCGAKMIEPQKSEV